MKTAVPLPRPFCLFLQMRDWREGKTKHLVEYGEGRAIITFPFGMADRVTVEKKCICEFVPTNLFGLLGFVLFFSLIPPSLHSLGQGRYGV